MGLSVMKALREVCVWAVVLAAGVLAFHHFEDAYKALAGNGWTAFAVSAPKASGEAPPAWAARPEAETGRGGGVAVASAAPRLFLEPGSWTPTVVPPAVEPKSVLLQANVHGHFDVAADINGKTVELMTDTGATYVALIYETAAQLGLNPQNLKFSGRSNTANGVARVAPLTIDRIKIGDIEVRNVAAVIAEPGRMSQNLLGMSFIAKLSRFELRGTRLVLIQ
jgi:aspartyl protease family protein